MNAHENNFNKADNIIRVLLVDDQQIIAEGIRRMLEPERDIELHYCQDPGKAIDQAIEINARIILQDLVMPDIDGMTLVRFYKANHSTRDIPVIVLSSKEDPEIKRDAFNHGASDYLVKLPDKIELIARIRAHAKNYIMQMERDAAFFALHEAKKQLELSNRKLKKLSIMDGLTGISNRRNFDVTFTEELRHSISTQSPLSVILIDIDFFKKYNDTYGHQGGDDCLKKVAHVIAKQCTRSDDLAARYGGEEFVVMLPNTTQQNAQSIAERIRGAVEKLCIDHAGSEAADKVTISLGVGTMEEGENLTPKALLERADQALYKSKEAGRNTVTAA